MRINFNEGWEKYPRFPVALTIYSRVPFYYLSVKLWLVSFRVGWPNTDGVLSWNIQREACEGRVLFGNLRD